MIIILLISIVIAFRDPQCNGVRYKCGVANKAKVCVNVTDYQSKIHDLQACGNDEVCLHETAAYGKPVFCSPKPKQNLTLPGEYCRNNSNCLSGICNQGVCKGQDPGLTCVWHGDCDVGSFCNTTSKCESQKNFQQQCNNDFECSNDCVCNKGRCAFFYSLTNGIQADNEKACLTGYIDPFFGYCSDGPVSEVKARPCNNDGDCLLLDTTGRLVGYSVCSCGFNAGSFAYCNLAQGDKEYLDMISAFQWILYTNQDCHTSLRYGPCRHLYDDEVNNYWRKKMFYEMQPQIKFNDECIQSVYTHAYWGINTQIMMTTLLIYLLF